MNEAFRSSPRAPVGPLILIALMYLPWLLYFLPREHLQPGESDFGFPGGFIILLFGFFYFVTAIALPIRLYGRRDLSRAHGIAFNLSLGILALVTAAMVSSLIRGAI